MKLRSAPRYMSWPRLATPLNKAHGILQALEGKLGLRSLRDLWAHMYLHSICLGPQRYSIMCGSDSVSSCRARYTSPQWSSSGWPSLSAACRPPEEIPQAAEVQKGREECLRGGTHTALVDTTGQCESQDKDLCSFDGLRYASTGLGLKTFFRFLGFG